MQDDEVMPVLNTKVSRKEHDRFVANALYLRRTPYALLQVLVYRFNEMCSTSGLEVLYATRRKLEAEFDRRFEAMLVEQAKTRPMAAAQDIEDDESHALKQFVAAVNEDGIPAAVSAMRELKEDVRIRVQTRLAKDLPDLWRKVRPYISGKPQVNPDQRKPGVNPSHGEEGEDYGKTLQ